MLLVVVVEVDVLLYGLVGVVLVNCCDWLLLVVFSFFYFCGGVMDWLDVFC